MNFHLIISNFESQANAGISPHVGARSQCGERRSASRLPFGRTKEGLRATKMPAANVSAGVTAGETVFPAMRACVPWSESALGSNAGPTTGVTGGESAAPEFVSKAPTSTAGSGRPATAKALAKVPGEPSGAGEMMNLCISTSLSPTISNPQPAIRAGAFAIGVYGRRYGGPMRREEPLGANPQSDPRQAASTVRGHERRRVKGDSRRTLLARPDSTECTDWLADRLRTYSAKDVAELTGCTARAGENAKQGMSGLSMGSIVALCRNDPIFRAEFFRFCGGYLETDPEFVAGITMAMNSLARRKASEGDGA